MYTLDDLHAATAALESAERRWENYDGNNPSKLRSSVTDVRVKVREIEDDLKARGLLWEHAVYVTLQPRQPRYRIWPGRFSAPSCKLVPTRMLQNSST